MAEVYPQLRMILKRQRVLAGASCSVRLIDTFALAARRFLAQHPLETGMRGPLDPRPVHLVVLGLVTLGRALVVQAIRTGHYANLLPLHITIVDRRAEEKYRQLLWLWPHLREACRLEVIEAEFDDPQVIERLRTATAHEALRTVAICVDDDARAVTAALRVRELLHGSSPRRLTVRLGQGKELAGLLSVSDSADGMPATEVVVLGTHAQALYRILAGWTLGPKDKAARRSPSLVAWEALPEDIRELDREPVRNIPALLAAAGLYVERVDGPTAQRGKPSS